MSHRAVFDKRSVGCARSDVLDIRT